MKTFVLVLKIVAIVALVAMIPVIVFVRPQDTQSGKGLVFEKNEMPVKENLLTFVDPYDLPEDDESKIALAARMYEVANRTIQDLDACAFWVSYNTEINIDLLIKLSIPVYGYRYQLKTGTEYYATEYALPQGSADMLASVFAKESSMFAMRSYTDVSKMDYAWSQKCYSPTFVTAADKKRAEEGEDAEIAPEDESLVVGIESDFSEANLVAQKKWATEQKTPVFCKRQEGTYYAAGRPVTENNILSAEIEYVKSKDGNFYRIVVELDTNVEETWKNTIDELRAGAGEDARYDKMVETLEIWENGYYKSFKSVDNCSAMDGHMAFVFDFDTYFFYDEDHLDPARYDNFAEAKALALAYDQTR